MSEEVAKKRILQLENLGDITGTEYFAVDDSVVGTKKINIERVIVALDSTLSQEGEAADAKATGDEIEKLEDNSNLLCDMIPDTTQSYLFENGAISQIIHTDNDDEIVRTDSFIYGDNSITEVRTLSEGQTLTIVTNLVTLETTITYSVEEV